MTEAIVVTNVEQELLGVLRALSNGGTVILESGATNFRFALTEQVGRPSGVPQHITVHEQGGFVVTLHNGESAYYNLRRPSVEEDGAVCANSECGKLHYDPGNEYCQTCRAEGYPWG